MGKQFTKKLILEDGHEFYGYSFGAEKDAVCELVFNTSMVGYQEIVTDPSYTDQAVVMTYPLIGNYGMNDEDSETKNPSITGIVVREYNPYPSNFRYTKTLGEVLIENDIIGISGVDTRMITRIIRSKGSQRALLCSPDITIKEGLKRIEETPIATDSVKRVSCKHLWYSRTPNYKYNVVAIDCGIKLNVIRSFNKLGCNMTVVPYNTSSEEIMNINPDGIFLSNGPGNPEDVVEVINTVKALSGKIPMFGICLGHQIMSLAGGAKTYKMKFGHRGGNHPVMNLDTGKIEITSQNHSYAVDESSIKNTTLKITHKNLLDNTVEGIISEDKSMFSVQYHPERAPGPQDSVYLLDEFVELMNKFKGGENNA